MIPGWYPMKIRRFMLSAVALGAVACLPEYQPRQADEVDTVAGGPAELEKPVGESVEWLYVADESATPSAQCKQVLTAMKAEDTCKGALCKHALRLGADWVRECAELVPDGTATVRGVMTKLKEQGPRGFTECDQQATDFIEKGCKSELTCEQEAQGWATRCSGAIGSPLVVRMVRLSLATKLGKTRLKLDARGCSDLAQPVREDADCIVGTPCANAVEKVDLLRTRCIDAGLGVSPSDAVAVFSIVAGAGQWAEPILLAPDPQPLAGDDVRVPLADGSGAVLLLCNRRPKDVGDYLKIRKSCKEGEIFLAKIDPEGDEPRAFLTQLDYFGDEHYFTRLPSLVVTDEIALRDQDAARELKNALSQAVGLSRGTSKEKKLEARAKLMEALVTHLGRIRKSDVFKDQLTGRDAELVPIFAELGKQKHKAARKPPPGGLVPFVRRGEYYAFADVKEDGEIEFGAKTLAAALDLSKLLPKSMAAYGEELLPRIKQVNKERFPSQMARPYVARAKEHAITCGKAAARLEESEKMEVVCGARQQKCDEDVVLDDDGLEETREEAAQAYLEAHLNAASVPSAHRKAADAAIEKSKCRAPWW